MFDSGSHTRLLLIVLIHFKINVMLCYVMLKITVIEGCSTHCTHHQLCAVA